MARHRQRGGDMSLYMPLLIAIVVIGVVVAIIGITKTATSKPSGPPPSIAPVGPSHSIMPGPSPPS